MLRQIMMRDNGRRVFKTTTEEWNAVDQKFKTFITHARLKTRGLCLSNEDSNLSASRHTREGFRLAK